QFVGVTGQSQQHVKSRLLQGVAAAPDRLELVDHVEESEQREEGDQHEQYVAADLLREVALQNLHAAILLPSSARLHFDQTASGCQRLLTCRRHRKNTVITIPATRSTGHHASRKVDCCCTTVACA